MKIGDIHGSFRDPSGFVFLKDNTIYRQINIEYKENYDFLMSSGLYKDLVDSNLLIAHKEVDIAPAISDKAYKIIKPEPINFISYPYEWSFSQLKDAALTTLKIQKRALDFGMSLKDCSAYNIQFKDGKPILIDTLSFEKYNENIQWVAPYRQFCRHFLAPLSLMRYVDVHLNQLLSVYIDGIPLDFASTLLPIRTKFKLPLFYHLHINAKLQKHFADKPMDTKKYKLNLKALFDLISKLKSATENLKWNPKKTEWADYYDSTNYSSTAFDHKKYLVEEFLKKTNPKSVLDLGANTGVFSHIAGSMGIQTISVDNDPAAVEKNYTECVRRNETKVLPLLIDLTNPSPDIGWTNKERMSFLKRAHADAVIALALIHHLAISNNLPLKKLAEFFNKMGDYLIIEFIPKKDSQVQRLLSRREDIFSEYTQECFETDFKKYFAILDTKKIKNSERTLYLMKTI